MTRRHRSAGERDQATEATRQKILDAAVVEFGAKGYSGARTASIAARAGVNQQLIAYYFGGKQGLLNELRHRWSQRQATVAPPDAAFAETLRAYLDATLDNLDWSRLVVWQALGDGSAPSQRERVQEGVSRIGERQKAGELTSSVRPEFIVLLMHMAAFAPVAMPQLVQDILGVEPTSEEYRRLCVEQLRTLLAPD